MIPFARCLRRGPLALLVGIALLGLAGTQNSTIPDAHAAGTQITRSYTSGNINVPIPESAFPFFLTGIEIPEALPISAIRVRIRLNQPGGIDDIALQLTAPNGATFSLFTYDDGTNQGGVGRLGSGNQDCSGAKATFTTGPAATQSLAQQPAQNYTGNYLPNDSFSPLIGTSSAGFWFLRGADRLTDANDGRLSCFEIEIDAVAAIGTTVMPSSANFGAPIYIYGVNLETVTKVTFTCSNLVEVGECAGFPAGFVRFGTTQLRVLVPAGVIAGPITLHFPGGFSQTAPFTPTGFRPLPLITSAAGLQLGLGRVGDPLIITGNSFGGATSVIICGVDAGFTIDTNSRITAFPWMAGTNCPISITNPTGTTTKPNAVTIAAPVP